MENHRSLSVHSLTIFVTCRLSSSKIHIIICISASSTCPGSASFVRVISYLWSPVRLRPPKWVLWARFDSCLHNILFSYNPLYLIIRWAWCYFLPQFSLCFNLPLRSLEVTWQHHDRIPLTFDIIPRIFDIYLWEIHLVHNIFWWLSFWQDAWLSSLATLNHLKVIFLIEGL